MIVGDEVTRLTMEPGLADQMKNSVSPVNLPGNTDTW